MRSPSLRRLPVLVTLALVLAATPLASCSSGSDGDAESGTDEPQPGGHLIDVTASLSGSPAHVDPALIDSFAGYWIDSLLFDGLTEWDWTHPENPELAPQVAESWEANEDGTEFTFHIRDDQQFSNGDQVLPSSFATAWDRAASPDLTSYFSSLFTPITGAAAVQAGDADHISGVVADDDAMTLTVALDAPFWDFPGVVTNPVFSPVPERVVDAVDDPRRWDREGLVSNGPFVIEGAMVPHDDVTLVRNEAYDGGIHHHDAYLESVTFEAADDIDAAYQAFEDGHGDTVLIPRDKVTEASASYPHADQPGLANLALLTNQDDPVLGGEENLELRQAISLAIDRLGIDHDVSLGTSSVPTGFTPPGVPGYQRGLCDGACEYDPGEAQRLLTEWQDTGHRLAAPLKLAFFDGTGDEDIAEAVRDDLAAIDVPVDLDPRGLDDAAGEFASGDFQMVLGGYIWNYPLYFDGVVSVLDSANIGTSNWARIDDAQIDRLLDEATETEDSTQRNDLYRQAEQHALELAVIDPINWTNTQIAYRPSMQDVIVTPLETVLYDEVWLDDTQ